MSNTTFPDPLETAQSGVVIIARAVQRGDAAAETEARQLVAEAKIVAFVAKIASETPLHPVQQERLCSLLAEKVGAR